MIRPPRVSLHLQLPPELVKRLRDAASERTVSPALLVTKALTDYLDRLIPIDEIQWVRSPDRGIVAAGGGGGTAAGQPTGFVAGSVPGAAGGGSAGELGKP